MTKETMFALITKAVKVLQKKSGMSEDAATDRVLDGMRAMPVGSVMDEKLFRAMLSAVVELESN
jgi:hypothetical protein